MGTVVYSDLVSAAIGRDVWQNTTDLIVSSPFKFYIIQNQTQATPGTRCTPHPLRSASPKRTATAAYHTTSALVTATITPTPLATFHTWHLQNASNTHDATGNTNINFVALTTTYLHSHTVVILTDATVGCDTTTALGKASSKQTNRHTPTNVSNVNHATTLGHELLDPTNTTITTCTVPYSMIATPTPMPKPHDTAFRNFINKINSALPYLEACGLLLIVWKVGKFFRTKLQMVRSKRSELPVVA